MNTVKLSAGSLFGLAAVGFVVMAFGVAAFTGIMVAYHPEKPADAYCNCDTIQIPRGPVGPRVGQFIAPESNVPVNVNALNEVKQQTGPCIPCQPQIRPTVTVPYYPPVVNNPRTPTPAPAIQPQPVPSQPAKYQIALFLDGSMRAKQLLQWFNTDPYLVALKNKCSFEVYTPENALYKTRYVNIVPPSQFPAALFLYPDGGHIHACGKNTIPSTPSELYADFKLGFEKANSVRSAAIPADNAVVKTKGYSWDQAIHPSMQLAEQDCGPDGCPPRRPFRPDSGDQWYPGQRVVDLFDKDDDAKNLLLWGGGTELVAYALAGLVVVLALVFIVVVLTKKR